MKLKIQRYPFLYYIFIMALFSYSTLLCGQTNKELQGMNLTDYSVSTSSESKMPFSLLELSSTERGFLMPRLTTEERRSLRTEEIKGGMMIYNTTIDCFEFYNEIRGIWLSLCGSMEPANIVIQESKCAEIRINGNYFEGVFLQDRANIIALEVTVSTPGTYAVEAIAYNAGSENGYAFKASGIFPTSGSYHIVLKGSGTPLKGYDRDASGNATSKGDTIKFIVNGKEATCVAYNFVEKEALKYTVERIDDIGKFYTGVALTNPRSGALEATINSITKGGIVEIYTVDHNGFSFSGKHTLSTAEINAKKAKITLKGGGAPLVPKHTPFSFYTNSYVKVEEGQVAEVFPYTVRIEPLMVEFNCESPAFTISHEGVFEYNVPLTNDNKIHVPVKVLAPGRGELKGVVNVNGTGFGFQKEKIEFTSGIIDFKFNDLSQDIQNVVLTPKVGTGKPTLSNKPMAVNLELVSKGAYDYDTSYPIEEAITPGCVYPIPVEGGPVIYEMKDVQLFSKFRSISQTSKPYFITPKTTMPEEGSEDFKLTVTLIPQTAGEYKIKTDTVNGIYFQGEGIIEESDVNSKTMSVVLKAFGKSVRDLPKAEALFVLSGNSGVPQSTPPRINIDFVYRAMTMYSIGGTDQSWHPGGNISWVYAGGPRLVRTLRNFGWDGIVRIDKLDILGMSNPQSNVHVNVYLEMANENNANTFNANLAMSDMVFIGGLNGSSFSKGKPQLTSLASYVKDKGGAVVYGEGLGNDMATFMTNLGYTIQTTNASGTQHNNANKVVSQRTPANTLVLGSEGNYFAKAYQNITLNERLIGAHSSNTTFYINSLPSDFEPIAYATGTSNERQASFAFVHKELGFVGVNNSTFMGGYSDGRTTTNSYPMGSTAAGAPVRSNAQTGQTYNSWFLLNLVHWAIDYAQEHQENQVK